MGKEEKVWVTSGTGDGVFLTDNSYLIDGNPFALSISQRMAMEKIGIQVVLSPFIEQMLNNKVLYRLINEEKAKKTLQTYDKKIAKDKGIENGKKEIEVKQKKAVLAAAEKVYDEALKQGDKKIDPDAKPTIIRNKTS